MLPVKTNIFWGMLLSFCLVGATIHCTENSQKNDQISEKKAVLVAAATEVLQNRSGVKELTPAEERFLGEVKKFLFESQADAVTAQELTELRARACAVLQDEPVYKNACIAAQAVGDLKPCWSLAQKLNVVLRAMPTYMQKQLTSLYWKSPRKTQLARAFLTGFWSKKEKIKDPVLNKEALPAK